MRTHNAFLLQLDAVLDAGRIKRRDLSQLARSITARRIAKIKEDGSLLEAEKFEAIERTRKEAIARISHFQPTWVGIEDAADPEGQTLTLK